METRHYLTPEQVLRVLGEVSHESAIGEIVELGATRDELLRAVIEVEYEDEYGDATPDPTTLEIVDRLKELIRLALDDDLDRFMRGYD
jgi:hypothetical protein